MTRYRPGDLVLVRFPFTDFSTLKKRPALVLSSPKFTARQGDVVVMALTSQLNASQNQKQSEAGIFRRDGMSEKSVR
jgi:mRNA interferase MazF